MKVKARIGELFSARGWGLRSAFRVLGSSIRFWPTRPQFDKTIVNYDFTRQLYRNDGDDTKLGGGFCKPIVDLTVQFMGMPHATVDDEQTDEYLNACLNLYWRSDMQQIYRNALRDGKTVVRFRKPFGGNPLIGADEKIHGLVEIVDPERVEIFRDPFNKDVIVEARIVHYVDTPKEETLQNTVFSTHRVPSFVEEEIWEFITPETFTYYNKTKDEWIEELGAPNEWGFVPLEEVYNEFESSLSGGQSEFESPLPFIMAFHNALNQTLQSHAYHAVPKAKFKINDITAFLKNNFPTSFQDDGTFSGSVDWKGNEIIFLNTDEEAGFVEATSVLGDSKTLLEFLVDCISIASETPEWAFMRVDAASSAGAFNAQSLPFRKKIVRKRLGFEKHIQNLLKMALAASGNKYKVWLPRLEWDDVTEEEAAQAAKTFQEKVMGLEVLAQRRIISDDTYRNEVRPLLKRMKTPSQEKVDAENNFDALMAEQIVRGVSQNGSGNGRTPVNALPGSGGRSE